MMNFLTQPQVPLDPRLNAAPMAAAPQPFVVGDYAKKKRIAEALRGKVGKGIGSYDPLITTAANDYFPGQVQVNYAGILGNAMSPWIEQRQDDAASQAEDEAQAARLEALGKLSGDMTPEQMLLAGEDLGMSGLQDAALKKMMPEKEKMANFLQAIPNLTPDGAAMLAPQYGLDPEKARSMVIEYQAQQQEEKRFNTDEQIRQTNATRTPVEGRRPTSEESKYNLWLASNPGKNYNDYLAAVGGGQQTKAGASKAAEAAATGSNLSQTAADLRSLIESDTEGELFGNLQGLSTAASNIGEKNAGTITGELASYIGGKAENPMTTKLRALNLDAVLEQARALAPVTDTDFNKLMLSKPNAFKTRESALAFVEHLERVAKRYNIPLNGSAGAGGYQGQDDDLLNKYGGVK